MIHEIKPYHFHNEYRNIQPEDGDFIISARDDLILMGGSDEDITFPVYGDLPDRVKDESAFTYLFAIDDMNFFLCRDLELPGYTYKKPRALQYGGAPRHFVYASMVGSQLARWYGSHRFCGRCASPMVQDERERMLFCPECGLKVYPRINPCVIVGVINDGKLLVSQYRAGFRDRFALMAGFAEVGETIEETAAREVYEETRQNIKNLRFYKSQPWPFSDSLLFGFFADLDESGEIVLQEDEIAMARWVTPDEIVESFNNFSMTNEMLFKFKEDYGQDQGTGNF